MAKSSSAVSTPSAGRIEDIPEEILAGLLRQPAQTEDLGQPILTELLLRGVLYTLEQTASPQAVETLYTAARLCPVLAIRSQAICALGRLALSGSQPAGDALYSLAILDNIQPASLFIRSNPVKVSRLDLQAVFFLLTGRTPEYRQLDPEQRLLTQFFSEAATIDLQDRLLAAAALAGMSPWVVIAQASRDPSEASFNAIHAQFGAFPEAARLLALEILDRLAQSGNKFAGEMICQLFIDYEFSPARTLAIAQGYTPSSPVQVALFYFLAEQWQIYEYMDFNQNLLASAYESAGANLRKRILYLSRYSGHTEWMNGLSSTSRQRWLWDMNDVDWEQAVHTLRQTQQYEDLWKLAQVASPAWSAQILTVLGQAGWQPDRPDEQEGFRRLLELSASLGSDTPPVSLLQTWPSPSPDISCMAISHDGSYIAVAGSNSTIHLWGIYQTPSPLPPIIGPIPQARALAFCPDGEYLAVANGDHALRAFRLSDGKLVKSLEGHAGLVRSLAFAPDGRTLFSASFDGTLRAWRFPQGPELKRIENAKSELFGLAASPDGQILLAAGTDQQLRVYRWPDGDLLWQLAGHTNTITSLVTVPRGQLAATAGRDGAIILWNYIAGRSIARLPSAESITVLAFHPNEQFILGATAQGNISIWNIATGKKIENLSAHRHPVTGLAVSPDSQQVFSASVDGTISVWDLQLFTWSRTPIGSNRSQTLAQVEQRARRASQKPAERNWLMLIGELIRWRQRFDVELEETHQVISVGEFDIEL
jgi:WD40 repeat protein